MTPLEPDSSNTPGNSPSANDGLPRSDQTLLRRFQSGDDDAATALYLRYANRLQQLARSQSGKRLASRLDPQDIVQSVFRTFFRRAAMGHYDVPDGEELWKLLLVIALNKIRSQGEFHRAARRDVSQTASLDAETSSEPSAASGNEASYQILRLTVDDLIAELTPVQREIVLLRIDGHDIQTIADRTHRSKRTVERTLQHFRQRMHSVIHHDGTSP